MKQILILISILLLPAISFAQGSYPRDLQLCWTHPTTYELIAGDTVELQIQPGDLANTRLTVDRHNGTRVVDTLIAVVGLPGERQCVTLSGDIPKPGSYTSFAYTITIEDVASDASNADLKRYTGKPQPAVNLASQ